MGYLKYKGYFGSVDFSGDDNCLYGKVLGMSKDVISYEGKTVEELKADFEEGIDSYLESCKNRGIEPRKAYNGSLNVRLTPEIHNKIAIAAQANGITINAYIKNALESILNIESAKKKTTRQRVKHNIA